MQGKRIGAVPKVPTGYVGNHGGAWLSVWQGDTSPVSSEAKDLVRELKATP
ncbi:hypothetical protein, partial [Frankia sp. AvcI1]